METHFHSFSGAILFWNLFLVKGSMALDTSDATTEQIKKASMSQTPVAKKETNEKVDPKDQREIYLAGGCFWGVEEYFSPCSRCDRMLYQVTPTEREKRPSMNWSLKQGMPKQFNITYNVKKVSLKELLLHYFRIIDQRRRIDKEMIKGLNTEQVSIMSPKKTFQPLTKSLKKKQKNMTNR